MQPHKRDGIALIVLGSLVSLMMLAIIALFGNVFLTQDQPDATMRFDGSQSDAIRGFAILLTLLAGGVVIILAGVFLLRYGYPAPAHRRWIAPIFAGLIVLGTLIVILAQFLL